MNTLSSLVCSDSTIEAERNIVDESIMVLTDTSLYDEIVHDGLDVGDDDDESIDSGTENSDEDDDGDDNDDSDDWVIFEGDKLTNRSEYSTGDRDLTSTPDGSFGELLIVPAGTTDQVFTETSETALKAQLAVLDEAWELSYEAFLNETTVEAPLANQSSSEDKIGDDGFPIPTDVNFSFMDVPSPLTLASVSTSTILTTKAFTASNDDSMLKSRRTTKRTRRSKYPEVTKCIRWWGHGVLWTSLAVSLAWIGTALSVLARQSPEFVTLSKPLVVSSAYNPLDRLGLTQVELCFNGSASDQTGCHMLTLSPKDVDDNIYEIARLFGSFSMLLGSFLTLFLSSAIFWETIKLRPIGFGLLVTYFCQSFTMLFFDAQVCKLNKCSLGHGCYFSIAAACCWVGSCITTAWMETYKLRAIRNRRRVARRRFKRAVREAQKKKKLIKERKDSLETTKTSSTSSTTGPNLEDLEDQVTGSAAEKKAVEYEI